MKKKRKRRSDKGIVKGPRKKPRANDGVMEEDNVQSDDAVTGPSKKKKAATKSKATAKRKGKENGRSTKSLKSQLPSRKKVIEDSEDDEDDEDSQ